MKMPVRKVRGGWRYGRKGHGHKVFKSRRGAKKQARSILSRLRKGRRLRWRR